MIKDRDGDYAIRVCDKCGDEKRVGYWNLKYRNKHECHSCCNKKINVGRIPVNKGKRMEPKHIGNCYIHSDGYPMVWVGRINSKNGYIPVHRLLISDAEGRMLSKKEKVHHINGVRNDMRLSNLYLCENMSHHRHVHAQLERVAMLLVKAGVIQFNKVNGEYYLSRSTEQFVEEQLGELLETPNGKAVDNQQPSSEELAEKVQRLFRKEVGPSGPKRPTP